MSNNTYLLHLLQSFETVAMIIATVCLAMATAFFIIIYIHVTVDKGRDFSFSESLTDRGKKALKLLITIGVIFMLIAWFIPPFQTTCGG
ncbi:TPA: hypothetical protein QB221_000298 [Pasteurella multocida]|uniref:hypothetical protein n=1 Tax=Pasteurella multocida TaxID=747 RepID=UPI00202160C6|nr:hypothetical protein [Pasteurella multocida]MCL7796018.1 hypothetical protein [Pasteurella multocida]HDR1160556.1 hypothetical protein [Pasteurella multocida]HDR1409873.1 hypothetical protein [Pasteurella multocida]HDR1605744.1 hypothetical protein [Pasteurella multocida]HDR1938497.1 hypothetical protein [Pasteurella multocida]